MPTTTKSQSVNGLAGPLREAAAAGDLARVNELLAAGAKPDLREPQQMTPLIAAAMFGHVEVVKTLLAAGANPSFQHGGKKGTTALLEALRRRRWEVAVRLIDAGAEAHYDWANESTSITTEALDARNVTFGDSVDNPPRSLSTIRRPAPPEERRQAQRDLPISLTVVRRLLAAGGKPSSRHLHQAAAFGDRELIQLLLAHGMDVNAAANDSRINFGESALAYAVCNFQQATAKDLLQAGAKPTVDDALFGPLLHIAVAEGRVEVVRALAAAGDDLDRRGTVYLGDMSDEDRMDHERLRVHNSTPLILAVRSGRPEIASLLLEFGANIEMPDQEGLTALAWALQLDRADLTQILERAGARRPAHLKGSAFNQLMAAVAAGDLVAVPAAIAASADVNEWQRTEQVATSPLMSAARRGQIEIVEALLRAGADPNAGGTDENLSAGLTPLMLAAEHGHLGVVEALLRAGARVESKMVNLVELALDGEARKRPYGDSAIHTAARHGHAQVVKALLRAGGKAGAWSRWSGPVLAAAAESGDAATIKEVLVAGANPNPEAKFDISPLTLAAGTGKAEAVRVLLAAGAAVNARSRFQDSPLQAGAGSGDLATVEELLRAGADPQSPGALAAAARGGHEQVIERLLRAGAPVDDRNLTTGTALHEAEKGGHARIVEVLLTAGANRRAKEDECHTARDQAEEQLRLSRTLKEDAAMLDRRKKILELLTASPSS